MRRQAVVANFLRFAFFAVTHQRFGVITVGVTIHLPKLHAEFVMGPFLTQTRNFK